MGALGGYAFTLLGRGTVLCKGGGEGRPSVFSSGEWVTYTGT